MNVDRNVSVIFEPQLTVCYRFHEIQKNGTQTCCHEVSQYVFKKTTIICAPQEISINSDIKVFIPFGSWYIRVIHFYYRLVISPLKSCIYQYLGKFENELIVYGHFGLITFLLQVYNVPQENCNVFLVESCNE